MKRMWIRLTMALMAVGLWVYQAQAGNLRQYGAIYGTYLNYDNSKIKDDGYGVTAYGSIGDGQHHDVELGLSQLHLNYKSGYSDLDQTDFTLAYTNTSMVHPNVSIRAGAHYITTDDDLSDNGWAIFADMTYFKTYDWNGGLEVTYSTYDNVRYFDLWQFSPHAGRYFMGRRLYLEARGYYINLRNHEDIALPLENYYSGEVSGSYFMGPWTFKVSGWAGQQMFAVKNKGFVVYNLTEKYKGGATGEINYRHRNILCGLDLSWNTYDEVETTRTVNQTVLTAFVGFNF